MLGELMGRDLSETAGAASVMPRTLKQTAASCRPVHVPERGLNEERAVKNWRTRVRARLENLTSSQS